MTTLAIPQPIRAAWRRPDVSFLSLRVWQRNRDVFMNIWKSEAIWPFVEPLLTLVALGFGLGKFIEFTGEQSYIEFIGPGLLAVYAMWMSSAEACWGAYFRMDQKTFDAIISTPASIDDVSTGEILWASTRSFISVFCIFIVVVTFGAMQSSMSLLILPLAFLPGLMFGSIGLCYSAIARSVSSLNYFFAVYITPQFWLAGVFFPVDEMPGWVQVVAWFMPAFHVVELYRALATGDFEWTNIANVLWILVVTAAFYALALSLMRRRLVK
jgi:lipooligosaccharide transport system permease protein